MFWGLIMEPGRCYTQKVKVSFHVSMAALDISNSSDDPAQVMCVFEGRNYLLCTLNKKDKIQCPLDLNFEVGSKVSFATNGKAHVHLTGYLTNLEDDYFDEEVEEEEVTKKDKKRLKKESVVDGPPSKKSKILKNSTQVEEEEESSDSDFEIEKLVEEESGSEDEQGEEEEADDDDDDEGEEEEDEAEEEASSLSEEEVEEIVEEKKSKPKQNGVAKTKEVPQIKKNKKTTPEKVPIEKPKKQDQKKQEIQQQKQKKMVLKGGVVVQDLKEGNGEPVKEGKFVHVYYEGRLKDNNKMFDSTTKGPGFSFRVGKGEVIKGWDIGLVGMRVGGKRRIICPAKVAYGSEGSPPVIPPNSTLVFDVEVKKVS